MKCNEDINSYKLPVIKVVLFSLIIALLINRKRFVSIDNSLLDAVIGVTCALIAMVCVLCICISICEMLLLHDRREATKIDLENAIMHSKNYSINSILTLLEENDIIELLALSHGQIIRLGASSNSSPGNSHFFDKNYYVNDEDSVTIEELIKVLSRYSVDGELCVISIDGISPCKNKDKHECRFKSNKDSTD